MAARSRLGDQPLGPAGPRPRSRGLDLVGPSPADHARTRDDECGLVTSAASVPQGSASLSNRSMLANEFIAKNLEEFRTRAAPLFEHIRQVLRGHACETRQLDLTA